MKVIIVLLLASSGILFSVRAQDILYQEINSGFGFYNNDLTLLSAAGDLFYGEIAGQDFKIVSPLAVFIHNPATGLENQTLNTELRIYPNPCREILYISFKEEKEFTLKMFNTKGIQVKYYDIEGEFEMETESLPQGIYLITITDKNTGAINAEKIIKAD